MKLKCIKTYYHRHISGSTYTVSPRISKGTYYEVLQKTTKKSSERYWLFAIPNEDGTKGSGWFVIDEYFETPEQVRDNKLDRILKPNDV